MRPFLVLLGSLLLGVGWAVRPAHGESLDLRTTELRHFSGKANWFHDATEEVALAGIVEPWRFKTKPGRGSEVAWLLLEIAEVMEWSKPSLIRFPGTIELNLGRSREEPGGDRPWLMADADPPPAHSEWRPEAGVVPVRERTVEGQVLTLVYWAKRWEAKLLLGEETELIMRIYGVRLRSGNFAAGVYFDGTYLSGGHNDLQASFQFRWRW